MNWLDKLYADNDDRSIDRAIATVQASPGADLQGGKGGRKHFANMQAARAYLIGHYSGHGRIERPDGSLIEQCRSGLGETIIVDRPPFE